MQFSLKSCLVSILTGAITLVAGQALAVSGPGATMKNSFPGDNSCLSTSSFGGIVNNCGYTVQVVGTLQVSEGNHPTSVYMYGNNSWCQTLSINGLGNAASPNYNEVVYTVAGPKNWQSLNLGTRYVWNWTGLLFRCGLESGGVIGNFTAQ